MRAVTLPHRTRSRLIACAAAICVLGTPVGALAAGATNPSTAASAPVTTVPPVTTAVPPVTTPQGTAIPTVTSTAPAPTTSQTITIPAQGAGTSAKTPAHANSTAGKGPSTAAVVVAVIAGLIALCALIWGIARMQAYEPRWVLSMRHSMGEAGMRTSATFDELKDWARLGR